MGKLARVFLAVVGEQAAAWIAVSGTLAGALVAGLLQGWQARRQREAQEREGEAQRRAAREALDRQVKEERFQRLRAERRELYSRLLDHIDAWTAVLRDLRDTGLPDVSEVRNRQEARAASPLAGDALEMLERMTRLRAEVELLADSEVRIGVEVLQQSLRDAFREAIQGRDGLPTVAAQRAGVLAAMRRELVHG